MAIRIRRVDGVLVALCAVETDEKPGDLYLDDGMHYALAAKFAEDWKGETQTGGDPVLVAAMDQEKVRDAREEYARWHREREVFDIRRGYCVLVNEESAAAEFAAHGDHAFMLERGA